MLFFLIIAWFCFIPIVDESWLVIIGSRPQKYGDVIWRWRMCLPVALVGTSNQFLLIGGWPTPLKNMSSSVGMITPIIWKNPKCSKPPTSLALSQLQLAIIQSLVVQNQRIEVWRLEPHTWGFQNHEFFCQVPWRKTIVDIHCFRWTLS